MAPSDIRIREITPLDAPEASILCAELGYPVTVDALRHRIEYLMCQPDHVIFVACVEQAVVGWIDVTIAHVLASEPRAEIAGLVVSPAMRSRGIGHMLVMRAEQWAFSRGLKDMLVRSRVSREDAHRFYLREGYARTKTSAVFTKHLAPASRVH